MMFRAEAERWAAEHVQPAHIDIGHDGRRVVITAPPITSIREDGCRALGLDDMFQADGTVWLDSAGEYRYRRLRDLPDGAAAYERI